jgi:hypothetical protein
MKAKTLTAEEHKQLGLKLASVRQFLMGLSCKLPNTYGETSKVGILAIRPLNHLDKLISELDNQVFRDCPNDPIDHTGVYYPYPAPPSL